MRVTFDENGVAIPDARVESYISDALEKGVDIHTSNMLVIDCLRAKLYKLPLNSRPQVTWVFCGKKVFFDSNLRSLDAWDNPLTDLNAKFQMELL